MKCLNCGATKEREKTRGDKLPRKRKFCSHACYVEYRERRRVRKSAEPFPCKVCGKMVIYEKRNTYLIAKNRGYALHEDCWKKLHSQQSSKRMRKTNKRDAALISARMRERNPMSRPEIRQKMIAKLKGRTFVARGGNGKPTRQQMAIARAMNLPTEYAISVRRVRHQFESLPTCYKVDLAIPPVKLAIEIDGKTHRLRKWRYLDARKTAVLNSLGWCILRFTNEQVDADLAGCLQKIKSTISMLNRKTTTSQMEFSFTTVTTLPAKTGGGASSATGRKSPASA